MLSLVAGGRRPSSLSSALWAYSLMARFHAAHRDRGVCRPRVAARPVDFFVERFPAATIAVRGSRSAAFRAAPNFLGGQETAAWPVVDAGAATTYSA